MQEGVSSFKMIKLNFSPKDLAISLLSGKLPHVRVPNRHP